MFASFPNSNPFITEPTIVFCLLFLKLVWMLRLQSKQQNTRPNRISQKFFPLVLLIIVPNNWLMDNLVFGAELMDLSGSSHQSQMILYKQWLRELFFSGLFQFFLGCGSSGCVYCNIGFASKYSTNFRTLPFGVEIRRLLFGGGIGCAPPPLILGARIGRFASSLILTRFWSEFTHCDPR